MSAEELLKTQKSKALRKKKILSLESENDLRKIRAYGRSVAAEIGFGEKDQTVISTAIWEIGRNAIEYAGKGEVTIEHSIYDRNCIKITVADKGPGIEDVDMALQEGFSSGDGLGVGLTGASRIMDYFEIQTEVGEGTTVKMWKCLNNYSSSDIKVGK